MNLGDKYKKTISVIFFTLVVLISSFQTCISAPNLQSNTVSEGKRYDVDGISFVFINGSFYEMGYQLGSLLKDEITINLRAFEKFYGDKGFYFQDFIELWNKQVEYIPEDIINYIQGTADALDISFEKIACIWVAEGLSYSRCCGVAAWGEATEDGKLVCLRSMEFPMNIIDPVTNAYVQEEPIIVIAKPRNANSFAYPTFAGYVCEGGVNEKGITVSNMWSPNHDQKDEGCPMGIRLFTALYKSSNATEAIDILTTNKTYGYNFIVTDSKIPEGYVVETTANETYVGTWNTPTESNRPFKEIKQVVRRANIFLNEKTAENQREIYNPKSIKSILGYIFTPSENPWFYVWNHYNSLSKGIQKIWGSMNLDNSIEMLRQVYNGKYSLIWNMILKSCPKHVWWQWTVQPETGEMYISFANKEQCAFETELTKFNYLESLESGMPVLLE